jgi:hypothetical protein
MFKIYLKEGNSLASVDPPSPLAASRSRKVATSITHSHTRTARQVEIVTHFSHTAVTPHRMPYHKVIRNIFFYEVFTKDETSEYVTM